MNLIVPFLFTQFWLEYVEVKGRKYCKYFINICHFFLQDAIIPSTLFPQIFITIMYLSLRIF